MAREPSAGCGSAELHANAHIPAWHCWQWSAASRACTHAKGLNETGLPYRALSEGTGLFHPSRTAPAVQPYYPSSPAPPPPYRNRRSRAAKQETFNLLTCERVQKARTLIRLTPDTSSLRAPLLHRAPPAVQSRAARPYLQEERGFIQRPALEPAGPTRRLSACAGSRAPQAPAARCPAAPQQRPSSDRLARLCG